MIEEDALYILRNTAWLGSNEKREEVEEAIETLAEALGLQQPDEEKAKKEKEAKEIKDAYSTYWLVPKCDRRFYRVCKINGKYGVYHITTIFEDIADKQLELLRNRFQELDIKPTYGNAIDVVEKLKHNVEYKSYLDFTKENEDDTD
jgi:hypothetical protein